MRWPLLALLLGAAASPAWPSEPFMVTGLPWESLEAQFHSAHALADGSVQLDCIGKGGQYWKVVVKGLSLTEVPQKDCAWLRFDSFIQPDGSQHQIRFLGKSHQLLGLIALGQRSSAEILSWWTLATSSGAKGSPLGLHAQDGTTAAVELGAPLNLQHQGLNWVFVLREIKLRDSATTRPELSGNPKAPVFRPGMVTSQESPAMTFSYTLFRQP